MRPRYTDPFSPVIAAAAQMAAFTRPWFFSSGWALDLHLGRVTRKHKDIDLGIFREDQLEAQRYLAGWHMFVAGGGELRPWREGDYLELPWHGIWAYAPSDPGPYVPERMPALEFLLNERTATHWVFRKDAFVTRSLRRALLRTSTGLPYLAPEVVLLHKGRQLRGVDRQDFDAALPSLDPEQRAWLRWALGRVSPGHEWLDRLS